MTCACQEDHSLMRKRSNELSGEHLPNVQWTLGSIPQPHRGMCTHVGALRGAEPSLVKGCSPGEYPLAAGLLLPMVGKERAQVLLLICPDSTLGPLVLLYRVLRPLLLPVLVYPNPLLLHLKYVLLRNSAFALSKRCTG